MSVMSAHVAESGAAAEGRGQFHGTGREYFRILARDTLALIVTLGMYRFWVATNMRRYLWSRTDLAGEQLDYTGDPIELLLGFLVLVVVLAPLVVIFAILSIASGEFGLVRIATYAPIVLLAPLAVFALYQARRYRVNHTVFRRLAVPSDRLRLGLRSAHHVLDRGRGAYARPRLSLGAREPRALQDAPYLLWRPASELRRLRLGAVQARFSVCGWSCGDRSSRASSLRPKLRM